MGSTRRSFTDEYKQEAVEYVLDGGRTIADVARNIGVHEMTLGKWVKKARDNEAPADSGEAPLHQSERAELKQLREENAHLHMQVAFAKKVATWFAKDQR
ncbi:MAG: transposase [Actinomycetota bacterium]|nr:transposase [Actinomycetota bacterium]